MACDMCRETSKRPCGVNLISDGNRLASTVQLHAVSELPRKLLNTDGANDLGNKVAGQKWPICRVHKENGKSPGKHGVQCSHLEVGSPGPHSLHTYY